MNHGTKPGRAKPGTTKKAKDKYIADVKKAAGQTLRVVSPQNVQGENIDNQELEGSNEDMALSVGDPHQRPTDDSGEPFSIENGDFFLSEDQEGQSYDERMVSIERENNQKDGSMVVDANGGQPQRLLFRCVVAPHLQAMTEEESLTHPLVDYFDPRNCVPKFSNEIEAIRDALKVTVDHFEEICGIEPTVYNGGNYISEYCTIQDQLDELFLYEAPALRRLERWEGSIFDWWQAGIEQDPCIGRKNPF